MSLYLANLYGSRKAHKRIFVSSAYMLLLCATAGLVRIVIRGASTSGSERVLISQPKSAEVSFMPVPKNVFVADFSEKVKIHLSFRDTKYPLSRYLGTGFFVSPYVEISRGENSTSIQDFRVVFALFNKIGNVVNWFVLKGHYHMICNLKSRTLSVVGGDSIRIKSFPWFDRAVNLLNAYPSSLVNTHIFNGNVSQDYVNQDSSGDKDSYDYFADSRWRTLALATLWCLVSWIGHFGWIWFVAHGIHDRTPRKVVFALVIFPFSVLAACHGAALLLSL
jgi:hypothetical protein